MHLIKGVGSRVLFLLACDDAVMDSHIARSEHIAGREQRCGPCRCGQQVTALLIAGLGAAKALRCS